MISTSNSLKSSKLSSNIVVLDNENTISQNGILQKSDISTVLSVVTEIPENPDSGIFYFVKKTSI